MSSDAPVQEMNWIEKVMDKAGRVRVADKAYQLARQARQDHLVQRLVRKTQDKLMPDTGPATTPEDEPMNIILGDQITTVTQSEHQPPPTPPQQSKLPSLLKVAAGAALTATGVGAGAGLYAAIPAAMELLRPAPQTQQQQTSVPESDTLIGVELDKD
jgi:hypothetical protein